MTRLATFAAVLVLGFVGAPACAAEDESEEMSLWEQAVLAAMVAADKEPPPPWKGPGESVWCYDGGWIVLPYGRAVRKDSVLEVRARSDGSAVMRLRWDSEVLVAVPNSFWRIVECLAGERVWVRPVAP